MADTLFNTFARNLNIVNPNYSDVFICPLCYQIFTRDKIKSDLSLAHVWPDSLGGKLKTLACKPCNNQKIGSKLESHLVKSIENPYKERLFPDAESNKSLGIKTSIANIDNQDRLQDRLNILRDRAFASFTQSFTQQKNGHFSYCAERLFLIEIDSTTSNTNILRWRVEEGQSFTIQTTETFIQNRVDLTYLHFAYMSLFHYFGYEWIFTPFAQKIKQQLDYPDEKIFRVFLQEITDEQVWCYKHLVSDSPYVFTIVEPKEKIGFAVASPELDSHPNHRTLVLFFLSDFDIHIENNEDQLSQKIAATLSEPLDLDKIHNLILTNGATTLSRSVLFSFLLNSRTVANVEEANQLVKKAYFS
jgi:hypothetical protein